MSDLSFKNKQKIIIGTDHRGYELKEYLISLKNIETYEIEWLDVGTYTKDRTDYPIYAQKIVEEMYKDKSALGIGLCGSGIGMSIAANRFPKIYAGLAWNVDLARYAKSDDNVNLLVLPADFVSREEAYVMIAAWLTTEFKGSNPDGVNRSKNELDSSKFNNSRNDPRYEKRLKMIDNYKIY